ncbi:hypothetical protein LEP1GSC125_1192 [Leptospira mayottensis 200901122]|uniref:Uncharacterized protein n=1 Tax=Leptospira mayottensis 200901122 TaxID=1193010 RepID=A0AA87MSW7_9LEPT|nr:hypothetical protein LEP1GSC125_1192 [Leptospira mayottensis 200901122]
MYKSYVLFNHRFLGLNFLIHFFPLTNTAPDFKSWKGKIQLL